MRLSLIAAVSMLALSGCATSQVEKLQQFTPESKTFVLLSSTQWDAKLRAALTKKGLKVLRYASTEQVVTEGQAGEKARIHNEAQARYGLTLSWSPIRPCAFGSTWVISSTLEVTDLKTNEVLMVLEEEGETGSCSPRRKVFDELATSLANNWK